MAAPVSSDFQRYLRILRKIRTKNTDLTQDDYKFFMNFSQTVDQTAIEKYQNTEEFKKLPLEEQKALTSEALVNSNLMLLQQPEYKEQMLELARQSESGKLSRNVAAGLQIALAGLDVATSLGQIREGDNAASQVTAPGRPAPLTADPQLKQALAEAQRGNYGTERALAPAQLALLDNYLADLEQARGISGGQAGTYGALAQTASTRRGRRALELAPLADEVTRRGEERYDNLLQLKLGENQAIQQSRAQMYPYDLAQYNAEAEAAGATGAAGRTNLRTALGSLQNNIPQLMADLSTRRRFSDIYNEASAYGPEFAKTAAEADMRLRRPDIQSQPANTRMQMFEQFYAD